MNPDGDIDLDGFAGMLTAAFGLTSGMPGDPGRAYDVLDTYGDWISVGNDHSDDVNNPLKVYLNILLFDKNFIFVDAAYRQLDNAAEQEGLETKAPHDYLVREVTVTEPGYAYIFLSNENLKQVDVHFDDVKITHTHSNIVAGADYYPYGLAMDGREITREPYRYGYQGQFSEKDTTTGWNEFELRFYDAMIARWLSADPAKQYYSPYKAMGNNPTNVVDPSGGFGLGGTLPEVVFSYTRLSTVAAQVGLSLGRSLMLARFANAFCPDCPDPLTGNFEVGDQYIFDSEGPHQGAVYELTDLTKGKDG